MSNDLPWTPSALWRGQYESIAVPRARRWMLRWRRLWGRSRTRARMPAGAGGLGRARPCGEHSNDRHQEAKEHDLFHVPPSGRWCVLGASA
jgi:hypothetical protein